jgi:hypothetical protein
LSSANPVTVAHQSGNLADSGESLFNRLFAIRVDQAAGRRREQAAGQERVEIYPLVPEQAPYILKLGNKALKIFFLEGLDTGRDDPPNDGSTAIQKFPNGCRVGGENPGSRFPGIAMIDPAPSFDLFEQILARAAIRTHPVLGQVLERRPGGNAVFGIAFRGIVHVVARDTTPFLH